MSRQEYTAGRTLNQGGWSTDAIVFALLSRVDGKQEAAIKRSWPALYAEFQERAANMGFTVEEAEARDRAPKGHSF